MKTQYILENNNIRKATCYKINNDAYNDLLMILKCLEHRDSYIDLRDQIFSIKHLLQSMTRLVHCKTFTTLIAQLDFNSIELTDTRSKIPQLECQMSEYDQYSKFVLIEKQLKQINIKRDKLLNKIEALVQIEIDVLEFNNQITH